MKHKIILAILLFLIKIGNCQSPFFNNKPIELFNYNDSINGSQNWPNQIKQTRSSQKKLLAKSERGTFKSINQNKTYYIDSFNYNYSLNRSSYFKDYNDTLISNDDILTDYIKGNSLKINIEYDSCIKYVISSTNQISHLDAKPFRKYKQTFFSNNQVKSFEVLNWVDSIQNFVPNNLNYYSYTSYNKPDIIFYLYPNQIGLYDTFNKTTFSYNAQNNIASETNYTKPSGNPFAITSKDWYYYNSLFKENYFSHTIFYTSQNQYQLQWDDSTYYYNDSVIQIGKDYSFGNPASNYYDNSQIYYYQNNLLEWRNFYLWNGTSWNFHDQEKYYYNSQKRLDSLIYPYYPNFTSYLKIYRDTNLKISKIEFLNLLHSYYKQTKYVFDSDNDLISQSDSISNFDNDPSYQYQRVSKTYYYYDKYPLAICDINFNDDTFLFFPNPTSEKITVECFGEIIGELSISDIQGHELIKVKPSKHNQIDLANLNTGIYIIKYKNKSKKVQVY